MQALHIHAGPRALAHLREHGLGPADIRLIPAAAGGPKGLILGPLDRFIFGQWLSQSSQPVHLVGASIGAWRMATACLDHSVAAFERLERDYIAQHYELPPGQKRPSADQVSEQFGHNLRLFYGGRIADDAGKKVTIKSEETRAYLAWLKDAWDKGIFPPGNTTWDGAGDNQAAGGSLKIIADTDDWDNSVGINTPGQSGDPDSPHYRDLFELWARLRPWILQLQTGAKDGASAYNIRPLDGPPLTPREREGLTSAYTPGAAAEGGALSAHYDIIVDV